MKCSFYDCKKEIKEKKVGWYKRKPYHSKCLIREKNREANEHYEESIRNSWIRRKRNSRDTLKCRGGCL